MNFSIRDIVLIALFSSIIAVLGIFPPLVLPVISVPITAQSMGVMLAAGVLGAKRGTLAVALFLLLVLLGLPLLSGGRGGLSVFVGPSAGFLFGWLIGAFVTGWCVERAMPHLTFWKCFICCVVGCIGAIYLIGVPWLALISEIGLAKALIGSAVFIPGDLVKAALAASAMQVIAKSYPILDAFESKG